MLWWRKILMTRIKLSIEGMHCQSCEILISGALKEQNGISYVKVNHKNGTAEVEFDSSKIKKEEIIETINKEGYKVRR